MGLRTGQHRGASPPPGQPPVDQLDEGSGTELYQLVYEEPIYPKNLYLDREPYKHAEYRSEVIDRQVELMQERDIWKRPSGH